MHMGFSIIMAKSLPHYMGLSSGDGDSPHFHPIGDSDRDAQAMGDSEASLLSEAGDLAGDMGQLPAWTADDSMMPSSRGANNNGRGEAGTLATWTGEPMGM